MTTARTTAFPDEAVRIWTRWITHSLEFLWLFALVAVPLAFVNRESFLSELELAYVDVPKTVLLRTLVGLMAGLWVIEWVLRRQVQPGFPFAWGLQHRRPETWLKDVAGWVREHPTRLVTLTVILYLAVALISTALSKSISISMWGLVPGQDTYPAYTITCYVVLFGVVAAHVKSKAQVKRSLWAVSLMGVIVSGYSWAQFYGHDVFNLREIPGSVASGSTLGNPILAGSVLLMTITISVAASTTALVRPMLSVRFWVLLGLWTLILTLQITALIHSSSRGPWVGTVAGLVVLLGLAVVFAGWRSLIRMAALLGLAAGFSAVLVMWPPPLPTGDPIKAAAGGTRYYEIPPPAGGSPLAESVRGRADSILSAGRGVGGGGLSGRIEIWKTSGQLIVERPWFDFEDAGPSIIQHLFGYGPDMFKYAYLLERLPRGPDRTVVSERFAHNLLIHRGVDLGLLGLLTTFGLFAMPALAGGFWLIRRRQGLSSFHVLALVGLMGALAGRFLEQIVGVAAISDLTIFWVLLALFAALPAVTEESQPAPSIGPSQQQEQRTRRNNAAARFGGSWTRVASPVVVAVVLIAGISALTWTKSINYLEAGFSAREGLDQIREDELQSALVSLNRAVDLAPDISVYHILRSEIYKGYRRLDNGAKEPDCAGRTEDNAYQGCLLRKIILNEVAAAKQRPLDWRPRLAAAESTLNLSLLESDSDIGQEAVGNFQKVVRLDPQSWWPWERLAAAHLQLGQPEAALAPLEKALAILDGVPRSSTSRLLQGLAYYNLGETRRALGFFNEAIRLNPKLNEAYVNRGGAYNDLGQYNLAIQDLNRAIKKNPNSVMAHNNRGNSYGNLNQFQKAIEDYDEAIRLDPNFALAYSNRALAYTYLGRDDEARSDFQWVEELGMDPGPILAKIEEIKGSR